jgi:hypothetical protein
LSIFNKDYRLADGAIRIVEFVELQANTSSAVGAVEEVTTDRFVMLSKYLPMTIRAWVDVTQLAVGALGNEPGQRSAPCANEAHFPKILQGDAVLETVLAQHSSDFAGERCCKLKVGISSGVAPGLVCRLARIDLYGGVRPQIPPQFADLLEIVSGIVWVVTDGQPNMSKRVVDVVVADLFRTSTEIDPGLTEVNRGAGRGRDDDPDFVGVELLDAKAWPQFRNGHAVHFSSDRPSHICRITRQPVH